MSIIKDKLRTNQPIDLGQLEIETLSSLSKAATRDFHALTARSKTSSSSSSFLTNVINKASASNSYNKSAVALQI